MDSVDDASVRSHSLAAINDWQLAWDACMLVTVKDKYVNAMHGHEELDQ